MRTLHFGLRIGDLDRSLAFYTAVGYEIVGRVPETPLGELVMLKLPGDEFVSIELVHDPTLPDVDAGDLLPGSPNPSGRKPLLSLRFDVRPLRISAPLRLH